MFVFRFKCGREREGGGRESKEGLSPAAKCALEIDSGRLSAVGVVGVEL